MKRYPSDDAYFQAILSGTKPWLDWVPIFPSQWSMSEREVLEEVADLSDEAFRMIEDCHADER